MQNKYSVSEFKVFAKKASESGSALIGIQRLAGYTPSSPKQRASQEIAAALKTVYSKFSNCRARRQEKHPLSR